MSVTQDPYPKRSPIIRSIKDTQSLPTALVSQHVRLRGVDSKDLYSCSCQALYTVSFYSTAAG